MTDLYTAIRTAYGELEFKAFGRDVANLLAVGDENAQDTLGDNTETDEFKRVALSTIGMTLADRSLPDYLPNGSNPTLIRNWFFNLGLSF